MIESIRNPRVVRAGRLHRSRFRRETGQTLLEGPNVLESALTAGVIPEIVFALGEDDLTRRATKVGAEVALVSQAVLDKLAGTEHPRGPIAVAKIPQQGTIETVDTVVLCGIQDPGNAGTLVRSAAAFGFQVVATADTADMWAPKVLRSAAGTHFVTNIVTGATVADVAAAGVFLVALVAAEDDRVEPGEQDRPIGLMVGNEARGLSATQLAAARTTLTVPMAADVESLNAAVAGSIAMFAIAQGRPV